MESASAASTTSNSSCITNDSMDFRNSLFESDQSKQVDTNRLEQLCVETFPLNRLLLSRHGESEHNLLEKIGGDSNLTGRGMEFGSQLAEFVNHLGLPNLNVWTSTMIRTLQTASKINCERLCSISELNEIDVGRLDNLTYSQFKKRYPEEWSKRSEDKLTYKYPDGESYIDILKRIQPMLDRLVSSAATSNQSSDEIPNNSETRPSLLIVSHQAVLRCILGHLQGLSLKEMPSLRIPHHTVIHLTKGGEEGRSSSKSIWTVEFLRLPALHMEDFKSGAGHVLNGYDDEDSEADNQDGSHQKIVNVYSAPN